MAALGGFLSRLIRDDEPDVIARGAWGSCVWTIDGDGRLTIAPADDVSGQGTDVGWDLGHKAPRVPWRRHRDKITSVVVEPGVVAPCDCSYLFRECPSLVTLDLAGLDTSHVTSMKEMFNKCSSLVSADLSGFDTSSLTSMYGMFWECSSLVSVDLSGWDTSRVTSMFSLFAACSALASLDLASFDTSRVKGMEYMFAGCRSLTTLDLSGFKTPFLTNMHHMFSGCEKLSSLDLSCFDTHQVTNMEYLFNECSSLTEVDLSGFDTSSVTSMRLMFASCSSLMELDLSAWDTARVSDMYGMFGDCASLGRLDISGFDTSHVVIDEEVEYFGLSSEFLDGCQSLEYLVLGEGFSFESLDSNWYCLPCGEGAEGFVDQWEGVHDGRRVVLSTSELEDSYDGSRMAGEWRHLRVPAEESDGQSVDPSDG